MGLQRRPDGQGRRVSASTAPQRIVADDRKLVPRPNYRLAKKQKELSRKARNLEKQQRRTTRPNDSGEIAAPLQQPPIDPADPTLSSGK